MNTFCAAKTKPVQARCKAPASLPNVEGKYWELWAETFTKWGVKKTKERNDLRHSVIEDVLGGYRKQQTFTPIEWDMVFVAMEMLLEFGCSVWSPEVAAKAADEGRKRRYTYVLEHIKLGAEDAAEYGAPEEYIQAISVDKFGVAAWRELTSRQLYQLMITVINRVRSATKSGKLITNAVAYEAANNNEPF